MTRATFFTCAALGSSPEPVHRSGVPFSKWPGWIFARKEHGYLALRSQHPYRWQDQPGEDCQREVIVEGAENIWICEMGRAALNGSFGNFIEQICQAALVFDRLHVRYCSPAQGWLDFGWDGDLLQQGQTVSLQEYPRYDNPYIHAEFNSRQIEVRFGDQHLDLDWEKDTDLRLNRE